MKKIISLLSAFAMVASLATVAFADSSNRYYIDEAADGTTLTLNFVLETNQDLSSASATSDLTDAFNKGATVASFTKGADSTTFNVNTTQKVISWTLTSVDGVTGTLDLGTVVLDLSAVTADFTLGTKRALAAKNTSKVNVVSSFTNDVAGYAISAPVAPVSDDFAADKDATTGEVTFANTDKATDTSSEFMTALEDNKVKLFNDKLTGVKADSRFTITYTPTGETKTFGHTIGEHFGISGDGAIEGTVAIALLFDKALDPTGFALEY